jgi:hypothetical protein
MKKPPIQEAVAETGQPVEAPHLKCWNLIRGFHRKKSNSSSVIIC